MFGRRFELFRVFGFTISADPSWFVVVALVTWTLARQVFPTLAEGLADSTYWWMGLAGALGLFAAVVLHELAHAAVARRHGLPIRGITLFIFGGVAEMTEEPSRPRVEFLVAIAGPLASVGIALVCFALAMPAWPAALRAVLGYLGVINLVLVVFNMIPAFPLDGGRVLRSALWHWKGDLRWATRVTSGIGRTFGLALIALGVYSILRHQNLVGGIWQILIGIFVRQAAQMSYQQLLLRQALEGESVSRFMATEPITVERALSVRDLVEGYFYRHHHKMFPVVDGGRLVGCVTAQQVRNLPQEEWDRQTVGAIADRCTPDNTVGPGDDALAALAKMSRGGASRLMVVDDDRLVGVLALKDLLKFFALKVELESGG